jgi:F-type H+-transporting ATPase subunit gamma
MSESLASLQRKINSATDLQAVVRTMKAMAAASIGQFELAVSALDAYYRNLELGLLVCLRQQAATDSTATTAAINGYNRRSSNRSGAIVVIVLGSDQGLVGQFNELMASFVIEQLAALPGEKKIWTLGERIQARLLDSKLTLTQHFDLPGSLAAITPLVTNILLALETGYEQGDISDVYLFHHKPQTRDRYSPNQQRLLPLDQHWHQQISNIKWPGNNLPEVIGNSQQTLLAFVHEYLFVTLFRSCAESLASENASRLLAMQRAEKNIDELQDDMQRHFHRLRQSGIDEELFDVVANYDQVKSSL